MKKNRPDLYLFIIDTEHAKGAKMSKKKFGLLVTTCRRCGKPLLTGNRSLYGNDEAKSRLDRICKECLTPAEQRDIETLRLYL